MNEVFFSAAGVIVSLVNMAALLAIIFRAGKWMGEVNTTLSARQELSEQHHEENQRRFARLEDALGISTGNGSAFVRRSEWSESQQHICEKVSALTAEVHTAISEGKDAVRIGHEDREGIKTRLTKVEVKLDSLINK